MIPFTFFYVSRKTGVKNKCSPNGLSEGWVHTKYHGKKETTKTKEAPSEPIFLALIYEKSLYGVGPRLPNIYMLKHFAYKNVQQVC